MEPTTMFKDDNKAIKEMKEKIRYASGSTEAMDFINCDGVTRI